MRVFDRKCRLRTYPAAAMAALVMIGLTAGYAAVRSARVSPGTSPSGGRSASAMTGTADSHGSSSAASSKTPVDAAVTIGDPSPTILPGRVTRTASLPAETVAGSARRANAPAVSIQSPIPSPASSPGATPSTVIASSLTSTAVTAAGTPLAATSAAVLTYSYGTPNATYHYRPLWITASQDGLDIWKMKLWVPEVGYSQTHGVAPAGEIAEFYDLQHGGTPFNYSPEGTSHSWSDGLMRMSTFGGDFADSGGLNVDSYRFTKTATVATGVTAVLTVTIHAPTVANGGFTTIIDGEYIVANTSGLTYDLWGAAGASTASLAVAHGNLTDWAIVNPTTALAKPNVHETDGADGHQLYTIYDWYGSTATGALPGLYVRMTVKDSALALSRNMRAGLTFELRADSMSFYYPSLSHTLKGSTLVSSSAGVAGKLSNQQGVFGPGATLPDGQSVTMLYQGVISTQPTQIPPVAAAGPDREVIDADDNGSETIELDGTGSFDPDGQVVGYEWTEGGQSIATGLTPHVDLPVGKHTITLTVTDDAGATGSDTVVITVRGATGYTWYVDFDGGSDQSDGLTPATAFQHCPGDTAATGVAAATALSPGDTVVFKGSVHYRGTVRCNWSGISGVPITYDGNTAGAFGTGRAIIDGADTLTGWTQCQDPEDCDGNAKWASIYWTYAPAGVTTFSANLYEDDQMLWLSQDPNLADPFWIDDLSTYIPFDSATLSTLVDTDYFAQPDSTYWDGTTYVLIWSDANAVNPHRVTAYSPTEHRITYDPPVASHYSPGLYSMCNSLKILDEPGEYVVREDQVGPGGGPKIYLHPLTPGVVGKEISVSVRRNCFEMGAASYVTVRGFRMQKASGGIDGYNGIGSAIRNSGSGLHDVIVRDNQLTMNRSWERQPVISLGGIQNCLVDANEVFENSRSRGMILNECTDASIHANYLRKNGGTAIDYYRSSRSEIVGNVVLDHTGVHANGITVYLFSSDILIADNIVLRGHVALTLQESTNITVACNVLQTEDSVYAVADWGACDNVAYLNNIMRNVANPGSGLSVSTTTTNVVVRNNIIDGSSARYRGHTSENNLYTSLMWTQSPATLGPGEVYVPNVYSVWRDPDHDDYHLLGTSPARDMGLNVGLATDIEGTPIPQGPAPDVGPYELPRVTVSAWQVVTTHGGDAVADTIAENHVEPRREGLRKLRVVLSSAIDPPSVSTAAISISGDSSGNLSPMVTAVTLVDDRTMEVTLSGPLPDAERFTVAMASSLADTNGLPILGDVDIRVATLAGDVDASGAVTDADVAWARNHVGETAEGAEATATSRLADVDGSGTVSAADLRWLQRRIGRALP